MKKLSTLFLLFSVSFVFSQSPWVQKKGEFYTQVSFSTIPSYNVIYTDPATEILGEITDNTFQFYGEYGLSNNTTFILSIPYKYITHTSTNPVSPSLTIPFSGFSNKKSSLGNIEIGIKHQFSAKKWLITGQLNIETNTSSFDNFSGLRTGYDAWSFTPLFIVGKGSEKTYLQLFTGATIRTNSYSSNFRLGGEYGYKVGKRLWLATFVDIVKSLNNGDIVIPFSNQNTFLYVNNQEFGGFGFKAIYDISNNFGINAGFGGAFFANNVAKQAALNIGLYHKF